MPEKSQQPRSNLDKDMGALVDPYLMEPSEEESYDMNYKDCLRYWSFNFLINGMFTTSRIVGYTQFMVFMILRVIITGSLCGRLYGNDPHTINCSFVSTNEIKRRSVISLPFNVSRVDTESDDVRATCLGTAYWNVSPITLWALGLLTVVLPWLLLLPWTPLRDDQDYVVCKSTNIQWPCLTIYVVRFMKACIKLVLEFIFMISVPIIYGLGIHQTVTCFDNSIICDIENATEKTYFLWLFATVNLCSACLTIWELVDICQNKHFYETDRGGYAASTRLPSNRSSTATMNTVTTQFNDKKKRSDGERGRPSKKSILARVKSKRRVLKTGSDPDNIVYYTQQRSRGKFKARLFRQEDGDEVIKLAASKNTGKQLGNRMRAIQHLAVRENNASSESLTSSVNHVVTHEPERAENCVVHATSEVGGAEQC